MTDRKITVQKFGGTSVATPDDLRRVARRVAEDHRRGAAVVVVVSAMGATTDRLMETVRQVAKDPHRREMDLLLATGEITSAALLAMALQAQGVAAVALSGPQSGISTNDVHGNARILAIEPRRILKELAAGKVVVVAGFQGQSSQGELTTLGRGGSDTTAVALAAALHAEVCQIFTDVDGVFTADPRRIEAARPLEEIDPGTMQALAWNGAQVLKAEAVEFARENEVPLEVLHNRSRGPGTKVRSLQGRPQEGAPGDPMWLPRRGAVSGVAGRRAVLRIWDPEDTSCLPPDLAQAVAGYDLVFGRSRSLRSPWVLYLDSAEIPDTDTFAADLSERFGPTVEVTAGLGIASLVGFGIGSRPHAFADAARVLSEAALVPLDSWTGQENLSFVLAEETVEQGLRELHKAFVEKPVSRTTHFGT